MFLHFYLFAVKQNKQDSKNKTQKDELTDGEVEIDVGVGLKIERWERWTSSVWPIRGPTVAAAWKSFYFGLWERIQ